MPAECPLCGTPADRWYGSTGLRGHFMRDHKRTADEAFALINRFYPPTLIIWDPLRKGGDANPRPAEGQHNATAASPSAPDGATVVVTNNGTPQNDVNESFYRHAHIGLDERLYVGRDNSETRARKGRRLVK